MIDYVNRYDVIYKILTMPSENTGKWTPRHTPEGTMYECSKCKYVMPVETRYCPDCGVKMKSETNDSLK